MWTQHWTSASGVGGGWLAFVPFFSPSSFQVAEEGKGGLGVGLLGPYIQNETPPLQSSVLVTVPE